MERFALSIMHIEAMVKFPLIKILLYGSSGIS